MNFHVLNYSYIPSKTPNGETLVLFHGTGGNEKDLIPIARELGEQYNILSFRGNVLENGMPRFFKRLGMGILDEDDLKFRTEELVHSLNLICQKELIDPQHLIALGYSNGANFIGSALVMFPDLFQKSILYRPMQPFRTLPEFVSTQNSKVLINTGSQDKTVNEFEVDIFANSLTNNGYDVVLSTLNTGHNLSEEDIYITKKWLG